MSKRDGLVQITNTYIPNESLSFRLIKIEDYKHSGVHDYSKSPDESEENIVDFGLLNGWKRNHSYLKLIEKWDPKNLSNEDILSVYEVWLFGRRKMRKSAKTTNYRYNELTKRVLSEIKEILMTKFWEKWTIKQLSATFNLNNIIWRVITYESKFIERKRRKEIIKSKLTYNISNDHIEYARDYLIKINKFNYSWIAENLDRWTKEYFKSRSKTSYQKWAKIFI